MKSILGQGLKATLALLVLSNSVLADTFIIKLKENADSGRSFSAVSFEAENINITLDGKTINLKQGKNKTTTFNTANLAPAKKAPKARTFVALSTQEHSQKRDQAKYYAKLEKQIELIQKIKKENPGKIDYIVPADLRFNTTGLNTSKSSLPDFNEMKQWDMLSTFGVGADTANNLLSSIKKTEARVAVLDTGLASNAPGEVSQQVIPNSGGHFITHSEYNEDDEEVLKTSFNKDYIDDGFQTHYHGTHVAGTIANNGTPNVTSGLKNPGVNPNAKLVVVKVLGSEGGSDAAIVPAIEWAIGVKPKDLHLTNFKGDLPAANLYPAKVVNLSLGLSRQYFDYFTGSYKLMPQAKWNELRVNVCKQYKEVADTAKAKNALLVFAAGNDGLSIENDLPGSCENMGFVVVQSTSPEGNLSFYSTHGQVKGNYVVSAPGGDDETRKQPERQIWSTVGGGYQAMQGTSMAAPHVAGIASLLYSVNPAITAKQAAQSIYNAQGKYVEHTCSLAEVNHLHDKEGNSYDLGLISAAKAVGCSLP